MTIRFAICCLLFGLTACAPPPPSNLLPPLTSEGTLTVYLQPLPQEAHRLTLDVGRVSAVREDGGETVLLEDLAPMKPDMAGDGQTRLFVGRLEPGRYVGLSLEFQRATLAGEDGEADLSVPAEPLLVEGAFTIAKQRASTLFLSVSGDRLITDGFRLTPKVSLSKPEGLLVNLKGFVSNRDEDSLTLFDKDGLQVMDTIATGSQPTDVALDQRRELLYVALRGSSTIEVIEVNNAAVFGRINLKFGDEPGEIFLSGDGNTLVSINPGSYTASVIDTTSLTEVSRIRLNAEPVEVFGNALRPVAYVTLPSISSLARIDFSLPSRPVVQEFALQEAPFRGVASADGASLYLLTERSSNLLVVDSVSLTTRERIYIGAGAKALVEEKNSGLVYVVGRAGEIVIIDPTLATLIDSFSISRGARFLVVDDDQKALFTVYPDAGQVEKFDLVRKKSLGIIKVGAGAFAAAIMGEE